MQIQQDGKSIFLRPAKGLVQLFDTANKGRPVSENEVRNGDADTVHSHVGNVGKVPLSDVFAAVDLQPHLKHLRRQLVGQVVFILDVYKRQGIGTLVLGIGSIVADGYMAQMDQMTAQLSCI